MNFFFKAVKARKLKEDAFRLEFLSAIKELKGDILKDFKNTTETWDHKPEFEALTSLKGGPSLLVGTDDEIYAYVNYGVPRHDIVPKKKGGYLVYRRGYVAKTKVGTLTSRRGGKYGKTVRREYVSHPGIEARNFELLIKKKYEKRFKRRMELAMRRAVAKSGHSWRT